MLLAGDSPIPHGAQGGIHLVGDCARGDGRAGEAVNVAAVFFHGEAGVVQAFAGEGVYPRADAGIDFVAEAGGFFVFEDAHAEQGFVIRRDADEQGDVAVVAFVGVGAVVGAAVVCVVAFARRARDGDGFAVGEETVVGVKAGRDVAELAEQGGGLLGGDAFFGGEPGDADGADGDGGVGEEAQGGVGGGVHR